MPAIVDLDLREVTLGLAWNGLAACALLLDPEADEVFRCRPGALDALAMSGQVQRRHVGVLVPGGGGKPASRTGSIRSEYRTAGL